MNQAELLVKLKIPDTTAITAFHTLERMGFSTVKSLERMDYYLFSFDGDFDKTIKQLTNSKRGKKT